MDTGTKVWPEFEPQFCVLSGQSFNIFESLLSLLKIVNHDVYWRMAKRMWNWVRTQPLLLLTCILTIVHIIKKRNKVKEPSRWKLVNSGSIGIKSNHCSCTKKLIKRLSDDRFLVYYTTFWNSQPICSNQWPTLHIQHIW